jgi:hypothetical protein
MTQTHIVVRHEWAPGARIGAAPDAAAEQLARLAERDGGVQLGAVVATSRDPAAPLHGEFEWDDQAAATQYRLGQAGHVVRCLRRVTVDVRTEEEQPPERVYVPLTVLRREADDGAPPPAATYVPLTLARDAGEQRDRLRAQALARVDRLVAELKTITACADIAEDLAALLEKWR